MRIAMVSDIHDNLTALEAIVADLDKASADMILHGGDLVGGGSSLAEVVDRVRELGWPGVFAGVDSISEKSRLIVFEGRAVAAEQDVTAEDMASATRLALRWLRNQPHIAARMDDLDFAA